MIKRKEVWALAGIVAFIMALVAPSVVVATDYAFVCENTASWYGYRQWSTGIRTGHYYHVSPLEEFVQKRAPGTVTHRWAKSAGTGKTVYGSSISYGCGTAGGAVFLRRDVLNRWVASHSDREVLALYSFLQTANRDASIMRCADIAEEYGQSR